MLINILIFGSLAAVLLTLFAGLFTMGRGTKNSSKRSNILMRWRVALQAIAIVSLMIGFYLKSKT